MNNTDIFEKFVSLFDSISNIVLAVLGLLGVIGGTIYFSVRKNRIENKVNIKGKEIKIDGSNIGIKIENNNRSSNKTNDEK